MIFIHGRPRNKKGLGLSRLFTYDALGALPFGVRAGERRNVFTDHVSALDR